MEPIIYIECDSTDAAFHFSVEEYAIKHLDVPVLMIWQTAPCVMLGSNQIAEAEADIRYAQQAGIQIVRRASGGGAIYTDEGTLLYTLIMKHDTPDAAKENVSGLVVDALNRMGVPAKLEGRNDICAEGKKFSGMAQYSRGGKVCTHGSLLYDTDLDQLARVLQVDARKFQGKAVRSVRSRVGNIKKYVGGDCATREFRALLKQQLCSGRQVVEYRLTEDDHAKINQICSEKYGNPAWTFGRTPKFTFHNSKRFEGGTVEVFFDVELGVVRECTIRGDFLGVEPVCELERCFDGSPFKYDAFDNILDGISISPYLGNISKDELLSCVFETIPPGHGAGQPVKPAAKPDWLRVRNHENSNRRHVEEILRELNLNTVCHEANCPNCAECFSRSTATFMIMGTNCTRNCRFCNVQDGPPQPLDPEEPKNIAKAVKALGLKYAVITSVTRDDLPDGGAGHFSATIKEIKQAAPDTIVEVLIPDFEGDLSALKTVADARPHVISHNMETVESLYTHVRPQAEYHRSLDLLMNIKRLNANIRTKSGFMLGLGETDEEVHRLLKDLRAAGCELLTIGQYMAPTGKHLPVREYVIPSRFEKWGQTAMQSGFAFVASAPLVRSSFRAGEAFGVIRQPGFGQSVKA